MSRFLVTVKPNKNGLKKSLEKAIKRGEIATESHVKARIRHSRWRLLKYFLKERNAALAANTAASKSI
ncbi:MAG: hypothetical protein BAJALOKI1v1_1080002 [Promethearchaeota archaeon]|nr:MAG: hypothetical protein BAJALOKI1v1_1080002 [Candidatus Lokiarchaeota archaeon]